MKMIRKMVCVMALGCALAVQSFAQNTENMPQAPQIVQPKMAESVDDAPELNFARPVQLSWLPCTNPTGTPVQTTYTVRFWRLMGMHPADRTTKMPPTWEVKDLRSPQLLLNMPESQRVPFFPEGELIAMMVVADVKTMTGQPVEVMNGGASPYTVFRVIVDDTAPVVEKKKIKSKSK